MDPGMAWHISLSRWVRPLLLLALIATRKVVVPLTVNLNVLRWMVVMDWTLIHHALLRLRLLLLLRVHLLVLLLLRRPLSHVLVPGHAGLALGVVAILVLMAMHLDPVSLLGLAHHSLMLPVAKLVLPRDASRISISHVHLAWHA